MSKEIVIKWGKCPKCSGKGFYFGEPRDSNLIDICMLCFGEGKIKINSDMKICGKCKGKGIVMLRHRTSFGIQQIPGKCDRCDGKCIVLKDDK